MVFTDEHIFKMEAYFRSGQRDDNGIWNYSMVSRFRQTEAVTKGISTGRPTLLTKEVQERIECTLRQLVAKTGIF